MRIWAPASTAPRWKAPTMSRYAKRFGAPPGRCSEQQNHHGHQCQHQQKRQQIDEEDHQVLRKIDRVFYRAGECLYNALAKAGREHGLAFDLLHADRHGGIGNLVVIQLLLAGQRVNLVAHVGQLVLQRNDVLQLFSARHQLQQACFLRL